MALVSVIMSSYNHERFIKDTIESVLNQSITDFELIIVDDGSNDNSRAIIKNFERQDERIKTIFHETNMGIPKTFNDGLLAAKGKYIAFIGSDDLWVKDKLEVQLEVLEKKDDNLIVWSEGEIIDEHGHSTGETFTEIYKAVEKQKSGRIFNELLKDNYILGSSLIFKRDLLKGLIFSEDLAYLNDYLFELELAFRYPYYFIAEKLVKYRIHGRNLTFLNRKTWYEDQIKLYTYLLNSYGNHLEKQERMLCIEKFIHSYLKLGNRKKALQYVYKLFKTSPFYPSNLMFLLLVLTDEQSIIRKFLRWGYNKFKIKPLKGG